MWEIEETTPQDRDRYQRTNQLSVHSGGDEPRLGMLRRQTRLPAELLILSRFGIRYPYLIAAMRLSQKYQLHPAEILIRGKVITPEKWKQSQAMLRVERVAKRQQDRQKQRLLWNSVNFLKQRMPEYSAATVFQFWQVIILLFVFCFIVFSLFTNNTGWLFTLLLPLTFFYTFGVLFRGIMLAAYETPRSHIRTLTKTDEGELPVYCILVALYKESSQIAALTDSLSRLNWPKHRLDIKLICEADDIDTIATIKNAGLPDYFQLLIVPNHHPKTKPKALNFALPLCHGEYLVLYDAEDLPSPEQLREAHQTFSSSDEALACLQAPLLIHNARQNWLTRMFAIEYQTLFTGILPILSKWKAPLPLGGTSNHFRLSALKEVGGWDPFNVTEDADLGIRLFRKGYRCGTLTLPTYEECPPKLGPWIKQRTRWIKGWMQTILVHNRNPIKLAQQLGLKNMATFHLFLTAIVISTLIHPIFIYFSIVQIAAISSASIDAYDSTLIIVSVFNLAGGYSTYALMAFAVLQSTNNQSLSKWLFCLPFYWLLISFAAWRALFYLIFDPHKWEKTPHGLAKSKKGDNKFIEFDT